jgi:hypothetical protein
MRIGEFGVIVKNENVEGSITVEVFDEHIMYLSPGRDCSLSETGIILGVNVLPIDN